VDTFANKVRFVCVSPALAMGTRAVTAFFTAFSYSAAQRRHIADNKHDNQQSIK
jgi:hypothetical protein